MSMAINLAKEGMENEEGGPFGCIVVKEGQVIGRGNNKVRSNNDPTAHAEVVAIRDACSHLNDFQLTECIIYTTCEPCPMCLGAIYWARPQKVFYASQKEDAAKIGFDDQFIYKELDIDVNSRKIPFQQISRLESIKLFEIWENNNFKKPY
ncbi:nucleoside deaminase [Namhaeicola litoreus]|uniref:Nucleoside deaminase n=1 Tax=Namhaeicola litoreus TaxID=1052145 RepID=A0ABW3Y312_9FLAO